jgi:hypothetical protein
MPPQIDPSSVTKQDLIDADLAGTSSAELNPATLYDVIIGEGNIGIISSLSDSSMEDGMYSSPSFVVRYNYTEDSLDNITDTEMGITVATYPYTSIFDQPDDATGDDGNAQVDLYNSVSDFESPSIVKAFEYNGEESVLSTILYATYSTSEISGLESKFGYSTTDSVADLLEQTINNLAQQVVLTTLNDRFTFQHTDRSVIGPANFPLLGLIKVQPLTGSAAVMSAPARAGTMGSTGTY